MEAPDARQRRTLCDGDWNSVGDPSHELFGLMHLSALAIFRRRLDVDDRLNRVG